jgi:hypothetical protein
MMVSLEEGITPENLADLYADPLIARIGSDGYPAAPVNHPLVSYLSARVNGEFVGAYIVVRFSRTEYEAHSLLQMKSVRYARAIGSLLIEWVFSHPEVLRLTGYIREGLTSAVNHCLKMGFAYEGFRRDALKVDGLPAGIHILGLTRKEWCKV